jgi:hypothetical protein
MIDAILKEHPEAQPAPDLQAELEATNRQVEILSDALAESRREVAALKSVQEPVAYLFTNVQSGDIEASTNPDHKEGEREMWYREPLVRPLAAPVQEPVCHICKGTGEMDHGGTYPWGEAINIPCECTTQPAAQRPWVGLTDEEIEACDCLHVLWTGDDDQELVGTKDFARAIEAKIKELNT